MERRINSYHLKMIALVTMLIDHTAAVALKSLLETGLIQWELGIGIYDLMRYIGRIAFPIYCFLLVEGFRHTKDVKKYAFRLGIFALISEVPFDVAFNLSFWDLSSNNVFFTLLIGLLLIWGISYVEKFRAVWQEKNTDQFLMWVITLTAAGLLVATACFLAEQVLASDYGMAGVLTILVLYLFRHQKIMGFTAAVMVLYILTDSSEIFALLALLPISMYDGTRGRKAGLSFYAFYPLHLLGLIFLSGVIKLIPMFL